MKEKLTPQEDRLYKYIVKRKCKCTTKQMIKYMKWADGGIALPHLSRQLRVLSGKGYINTKFVQHLEITLI